MGSSSSHSVTKKDISTQLSKSICETLSSVKSIDEIESGLYIAGSKHVTIDNLAQRANLKKNLSVKSIASSASAIAGKFTQGVADKIQTENKGAVFSSSVTRVETTTTQVLKNITDIKSTMEVLAKISITSNVTIVDSEDIHLGNIRQGVSINEVVEALSLDLLKVANFGDLVSIIQSSTESHTTGIFAEAIDQLGGTSRVIAVAIAIVIVVIVIILVT